MFAEKPKQLKDGKCDGHSVRTRYSHGECVKQSNQQPVRDEMAPAMLILARKLDKAGNRVEERNRVLVEFGKNMDACPAREAWVAVAPEEEEDAQQAAMYEYHGNRPNGGSRDRIS